MNAHDLGYTRLFSHARMMRDLVEGFIHEAWVAGQMSSKWWWSWTPG
ncbi:MAG: hypothetical protein HQL96_14970 [Magnetococcales bacterium]|nr:hypothetical protein [Magnetococcales bacterium]